MNKSRITCLAEEEKMVQHLSRPSLAHPYCQDGPYKSIVESDHFYLIWKPLPAWLTYSLKHRAQGCGNKDWTAEQCSPHSLPSSQTPKKCWSRTLNIKGLLSHTTLFCKPIWLLFSMFLNMGMVTIITIQPIQYFSSDVCGYSNLNGSDENILIFLSLALTATGKF